MIAVRARHGSAHKYRTAGVLGVIPALVLAAGCSSGGGSTASSSATGAAVSAPPSGGSGGAAATTVTVTETEFALNLSQNTFTAGRYTFAAKDAGAIPHALAITGPGVSGAQTAALSPGGSASLTVTLQAGTRGPAAAARMRLGRVRLRSGRSRPRTVTARCCQ
jgi:hypothetical protein